MTTQQPLAMSLVDMYDYGDPLAHGNAWKSAVCTELRAQHARIAELEAALVKEAARTASEKRRADQMSQQHDMQAALNRDAREQLSALAATQSAAQAVQPLGWLITKSKLPGDMEFTQDPMRENLARSFGYQTQALYAQTAAQGMDARDAARYRWLRNESWACYNLGKGKPEVALVACVRDGCGNVKTILAEEAMDDAIDAALAAQAKQGEQA